MAVIQAKITWHTIMERVGGGGSRGSSLPRDASTIKSLAGKFMSGALGRPPENDPRAEKINKKITDLQNQELDQNNIFLQGMKLFNQQFFDMMRTLGMSFRKIAGIRFAIKALAGKKKSGGGGGGGGVPGEEILEDTSEGKNAGALAGLFKMFGGAASGAGAGASGAAATATGGGGAAAGMAAAAGPIGLAIGAVLVAAIAGGALGKGTFGAIGLDEGIGKMTGILSTILLITTGVFGPALAAIAIGVGLLVGLVHKGLKESQMLKAVQERAGKGLGSIIDTIFFGFYMLIEKFGIVEKVVTVLTLTKEFLIEKFTWIGLKVLEVATGVIGLAKQVPEKLKEFKDKAVETLTGLPGKIVSGIGTFFTELPGNIMTALSTLKTAVTDIASDMWDKFKDTDIGTKMVDAFDALTTFVGGVGDGLTSAASTLSDALSLDGKFSPTALVDWTQKLSFMDVSFSDIKSPIDLVDVSKHLKMDDIKIDGISITKYIDTASKMDLNDFVDAAKTIKISELINFGGIKDKIQDAIDDGIDGMKSNVPFT